MDKITLIISFISILLLTSCSFTYQKNVSLDANYKQEVMDEAVLDLDRTYSFLPGEFIDSRDSIKLKNDSTYIGSEMIKDGGIIKIVNKTFVYENEIPISEEVFKGIKGLVENSGHNWNSDNPEIIVSVELFDLRPRKYKILFDESIEGYTRFKISLNDFKTGDLIYESEYENTNDVSVLGEFYEIRIKRSLLMSILDMGRDRFLEQSIIEYFNRKKV